MSHSTKDTPWLVCLGHELKRLSHSVFIDEPRGVGLPMETGIKISGCWYEALERELQGVDRVLAVWSPAAAAKMSAGRGAAFTKEAFWAAKSRKLVVAVIEQNDDPTDESDAAFRASMPPCRWSILCLS